MATFYTGATGVGTGPHLDFRVYDVSTGSYVDPSAFTDILQVNGRPLASQYELTSGYGARKAPIAGASTFHRGLDFATPVETPVTVVGGKYLTTFKDPGGGVMSQYAFERGGRPYEAILLHGSEQNKVLSTGAVTDYADVPSTPTVSKGPSHNAQNDPNSVDLIKNQLLSSLLAGTLGGSNVESLMPINIEPPPLPTAEEEEDDFLYVDLTSDMIRQLALQAQSAFKPGASVF